MKNVEAKPVMTLPEVAEMLGISRGKVYDAVRKNELPHKRLGGRILFPRRAIEIWLESWSPTPGLEKAS